MHTQTPPLPHPQAQPARRLAGFTLMEVLVALGLFTLGFVAIAALLPAGALLQRETADDIQSRHLERNAWSVLGATGLPGIETAYHGSVDSTTSNHNWLKRFDKAQTGDSPADADLKLTGTMLNSEEFWPLADRSFLATVTDPASRDLVWVPLVRDIVERGDPVVNPPSAVDPQWQIWAFVLRRQANALYRYHEDPNDNTSPLIGKTYPTDEDDSIPGLDFVRVDIEPDNQTFSLTFTPGSPPPISRLIQNDLLITEFGEVFRVNSPIEIQGNKVLIEVDFPIIGTPEVLWYAPPAEGRRGSPAQRVFYYTY